MLENFYLFRGHIGLNQMFLIDGSNGSMKVKVLWDQVIWLLSWVIWLEWKARIFGDKFENLRDRIFPLLSFWASVYVPFKGDSFIFDF